MEELKVIASTVPKEAWNQVAITACITFEKLIYPLTATTEGIGRLIQIHFDRLNDVQKIIAAKCLQETNDKMKSNELIDNIIIKPAVIYEALESTDQQTDETMRSLWSNLLAKEFSEGSVHPEIAKLLGKITSKDALLLLEISEIESISIPIRVLKALSSHWTLGLLNKSRTFNHVHLENIGLIHEVEKTWYLTTAGREFMRCVSDPQ